MIEQGIVEKIHRAQASGDQKALEQAKGLFSHFKALKSDGFEDVSFSSAETQAQVELDPEAEWERQVGRYLELEFHKKLRLSRGKFKDLFPQFVTQPEAYRGRFNIPVLVLGQIPVKNQCQLAGVDYYLGGLLVKDWPKDPHSFVTPTLAYATWMDDGSHNLNRKVKNIRSESIGSLARGATEYDGIALYIAHPEILDDHYIDLPGTQVESDGTPYLDLWNGRPELRYRWLDLADPGFGSALCGRQISTR